MGLDISVIVPCRNEAANIGRFKAELLAPLEAMRESWEILAVDDGSADGTRPALENLSRGEPRVRVIVNPGPAGLGGALRAGFAAAQGEWIVTLDADLTFTPSHLADLLARQAATGADLVGGSPFLSPGHLSEVPWLRRLPSLAVNRLYRLLLGPGLTAYSPIFRMYRAETLKALAPRCAGFEINAEIAALFIKEGRSVAETAIPLHARTQGRSKMNPAREIRAHLGLMLRLLAGR